MTLRQLLDVKTIKALAGDGVHRRGISYYRDGRVTVTNVSPDRVDAMVKGGRRYTVALWAHGDEPYWACSCAAAADGAFCKHVVAVALGVLNKTWGDGAADDRAAIRTATGRTQKRDLVTYVASLSHERLVEIVVAAAAEDQRLADQLAAEMPAARREPVDVRAWQRQVDNAISDKGRRGYVDYAGAGRWADGVATVIEAAEALLAGGDAATAAAVVDLTEYAIDRLGDVQFVDDSDGWITELVGRLADLHHGACESSGFDGVDLARRLHALDAKQADLHPFRDAVTGYAWMLGDTGVAEYRRLDRAAWEAVEYPETGFTPAVAFNIGERMLADATARGDVDEVVAIHSRQLSSARAYPAIIEALRDGGRDGEALEWADRGLADGGRFVQRGAIREHAAALLTARGEEDRARELFWNAFTTDVTFASYQRWLEASGRGGRKAAVERALDWLRPQAAAAIKADRGRGTLSSILRLSPPSVDTLLEALLDDSRTDEAWATARQLEYAGRLTMQLAEARETDHPLDAVDVYEPIVFQRINVMGNDAYAEAVKLMSRIRGLCDRAGAPERFDALLTKVRSTHKAKRNLMKLLDKKGWN